MRNLTLVTLPLSPCHIPPQLFITFVDLPHLGKPQAPWETPLGLVTDGMETVVDQLFTGYGDQKPFNKKGIDQGIFQNRGNAYIRYSSTRSRYDKVQHCAHTGRSTGVMNVLLVMLEQVLLQPQHTHFDSMALNALFRRFLS